MKRVNKIISFTLLLAMLLSTFAMLNVFAVDGGTVVGPKTLYDQNATSPIVKNTPADMTLTQLTSANGVKYYSAAFKDGWSVEKGGYTKEPFIQLNPGVHYLMDGWRDGYTSAGTDDTDYLVIDFDLSTDTNQFDQLYFQTLFYYGKPEAQADGSLKGKRTSAQSGHYVLWGDSGEDSYFTASTDKNTKLPIDVQSGDEWAHITMVVDATSDTNRKMYLYYNGQFISSRVCMTNDAVYLESVRIGLGTTGVAPDLDNETFSFANATIKAFPKGYSGELAEEKGNLGSAQYPLSSFGDLGYCLDNLPENTVAKVTHADATETLVTRISDLDGNLKAGDTVTLYRDIARKIVVPGKTEGDSALPAVTFDLNGHSMVAPLALADYDELDWIIRNGDGELVSYASDGATIYAKGAQTYADGKLSADSLFAFLTAAFPKGIADGKTYKVTFLKDTSIKYTASLNHGKSHVTYDLNGKTLNILSGSKVFQTSDSTSRVVVRDGIMINGTSNPFYMSKAARYYVSNVDLTANNSLSDIREGALFFIGSKITAANTVAAVKSYSNALTYTVFDGCEITIDGASPISLGNVSISGSRRGSMTTFAGIYNTTASGDESLVHVNYYANEYSTTDAETLANSNQARVSLQGVKIGLTGTAPAIMVDLQTLADAKVTSTFAEGMSALTSVYIDGSDINADTLVSSSDSEAIAHLNKNSIAIGNYTANTNVTLKNSKVKTGKYVVSNTIGTANDNGELVLSLNDNVSFSSNSWAAETDSAVKIEFAEGVKLAYSYDVQYPFIATLNWTESTLVGERPEITTVKLSQIYADGMVLQGYKDINISGTCATIGATIEVKLGDNARTTTVAGDGTWRVVLPPMEYAKGLTLTINEVGLRFPETKFEDVKIGELWIMSGQSNSVYGVYKMEDFAEYRSNADNFDNIYAFAVNQGQSIVEKTEAANSGWYKVDSKALTKDDRYTGISAIAYVMATRLATELGKDVTIGIIDINFNGSTVEAWMSPENLSEVDPELNEKYSAYREFYLKNGTYPSESDVSDYGTYVASGKLYSKMACACYNAMIAPFFDGFSIRGALWYQGEGNASSVTADSDGDYTKHFTGVRNTFRDVFADEELPVFIVQLPPRMGNPFYFRALQYDIAANDENTYLVLSHLAGSTFTDNELKNTGPSSDSMVHYERKSPVGLAVADSVLENVYGRGQLSAPKILSIEKRGNAIVITFDRELTTDSGSEMIGFEISTADGAWVDAKAAYADKVVVLTAEGVTDPTGVRYGAAKSVLILDDGTEIIYNKSDCSFTENDAEGTITITYEGKSYVIHTNDPAVIGARMPGNVVATNGTALLVFTAVVE
ncbi:MAG: hypothetical protein IKC87_07080 [Clostridia bacterium]|nr:hypothetical protein [Clostridia bacterium]